MAPRKINFDTKIFRKEEIRDAKKWFRDKLKALEAGDLNKNMSDIRYRGKIPLLGRMTYFKYHAKHEKTLPYWDVFPLSVMIDERNDSFLGLNLHYLPPKLRGVFLTQLLDVVNNDRFDKSTKLELTYEILKGASKYRYFKPCIKMYLKKQIRSNIMLIRPQQWHVAINLPVAKFKGASASTVWSDSLSR